MFPGEQNSLAKLIQQQVGSGFLKKGGCGALYVTFAVILYCSRVLFLFLCPLTSTLVGQEGSLCEARCISRSNGHTEL